MHRARLLALIVFLLNCMASNIVKIISAIKCIQIYFNGLYLLQETETKDLVKDSVEDHLMVDVIVITRVTVGVIAAKTRLMSVEKSNVHQETI